TLDQFYTEMKLVLELLDLNNFLDKLANSLKINDDDDDFFDQLKTIP
ncbi:1741_t:CDS:1, partial [Scutellospora calospora]